MPLPDKKYLPARDVWERYGRTNMTLHRWLKDPKMNFPRPIYFGRFRYFAISAIEQWERERLAESLNHKTEPVGQPQT